MTTYHQACDIAMSLPSDQRQQLAAAILVESTPIPREEWTAAWMTEIERRRERLARGETHWVDHDEMMARLMANYS